MARQQISLKQLAIDKDNATIAIVIGIATFITIFSLVASKSLLTQSSYQGKVIKQKKIAVKQLEENAKEVKKLDESYQLFAEQSPNILEGSKIGTGERDGDNARIVLDALPSKYDFPALATSLEKAFRAYEIESITGTDDEITQSTAAESANPQSVEIPFTISVKVAPNSSADMLKVFERSIRPIKVKTIDISTEGDRVKFSVDAKTYFQPKKKFEVTQEAVKK